MEDTLEKRILKSNLSDDDKIEIIQRLSNRNKEYIYVPQKLDVPPCPCPSYPNQIGTPQNPWYGAQPYCACQAK